MSTPTTIHARAERRTRYGSMTIVLVAAATIALLLLGVIGGRVHKRFDATATREQSLSARSTRILAGLGQPVEIVVATDATRLDGRARQRVGDVLTAFTQASSKVRITTIDVASPGAAAIIAETVKRSADRHSQDLQRHEAAFAQIESLLARLAERCPALGAQADGVTQRLPVASAQKEEAANIAALFRAISGEASRVLESAGLQRVASGALQLPANDTALKSADAVFKGVISVSDRVGALASGMASTGTDDPGVLSREATALRDAVLATTDTAQRLPPLEPLMVARMLASRQGVLVLSPDGAQGIDQEALFPSTSRIDAAGASSAQLGFAGEEIIAGAIAAVSGGTAPIVVFVHAEREPMLDAQGRPTPATAARIGRFLDRLAQRRIGIAEWAVAKDASRPNLNAIDPSRKRPVVWFVLGAPSRIGESARENSASDRPARVRTLATALGSLLDSGERVLINVEPSELPGVGEPDPLGQPLISLGVTVDTARPIIERLPTPDGSAFSAYQTVRRSVRGHPISDAIDALAITMLWPMGITISQSPPTGITIAPLLRVDTAEARWGESQWLGLRYMNVAQPFKAISPRDPPSKTPERDDIGGPWVVAAAIERLGSASKPVAGATGDESGVQRIVVVASPSWFEDLYSEAATMVEGRRVLILPGNRELADTAITWLAGLDSQLAGSPEVRDVPRIASLSPTTLSVLRWALAAGMPLAALGLGLFLRWRGGSSSV